MNDNDLATVLAAQSALISAMTVLLALVPRTPEQELPIQGVVRRLDEADRAIMERLALL